MPHPKTRLFGTVLLFFVLAACSVSRDDNQFEEIGTAIAQPAIDRKMKNSGMSRKDIDAIYKLTPFMLGERGCTLFELRPGIMGRNYVVCFEKDLTTVAEENYY